MAKRLDVTATVAKFKKHKPTKTVRRGPNRPKSKAYRGQGRP